MLHIDHSQFGQFLSWPYYNPSNEDFNSKLLKTYQT